MVRPGDAAQPDSGPDAAVIESGAPKPSAFIQRTVLHRNLPFREKYRRKGGENMKKQEEKKPIPWEAADPKPPVVQSGHMENRREYDVR